MINGVRERATLYMTGIDVELARKEERSRKRKLTKNKKGETTNFYKGSGL